MAARFHSPHARRTGHPAGAALRLVPALLAPVVPLPHPPARPAHLVVLACPPCGLTAGPMPAADAEQTAGAHDDDRHGGTPTAVLRTVHTPRRTSAAPSLAAAGGPDYGGAA
jgi:hypothetical protein